ncbi:MAG: L-lactate permease, partial [Planctomycetota bacterium]
CRRNSARSSSIEGLLTAPLPLSIVFGAVVLFRTLWGSGALDAITLGLERSTPDRVMRIMLIA